MRYNTTRPLRVVPQQRDLDTNERKAVERYHDEGTTTVRWLYFWAIVIALVIYAGHALVGWP